MRVVSTSINRSTNTLGLRLRRLSCSSGTPPSGREDSTSEGDGAQLEGEPEEETALAVEFFAVLHRSRMPAIHRGRHSIFAIKPEVPANMKLSRKKLCCCPRTRPSPSWSSGRNLDFVHRGEHLKVGAAPDGEELLPGQAADARELELKHVKLRPFMSTAMIFFGPWHR